MDEKLSSVTAEIKKHKLEEKKFYEERDEKTIVKIAILEAHKLEEKEFYEKRNNLQQYGAMISAIERYKNEDKKEKNREEALLFFNNCKDSPHPHIASWSEYWLTINELGLCDDENYFTKIKELDKKKANEVLSELKKEVESLKKYENSHEFKEINRSLEENIEKNKETGWKWNNNKNRIF